MNRHRFCGETFIFRETSSLNFLRQTTLHRFCGKKSYLWGHSERHFTRTYFSTTGALRIGHKLLSAGHSNNGNNGNSAGTPSLILPVLAVFWGPILL